jgi:tripartite ATP-independent transporter DctP family solute receptor
MPFFMFNFNSKTLPMIDRDPNPNIIMAKSPTGNSPSLSAAVAVVGCLLIAMAGCSNKNGGADVVLKFGHSANESDIWHQSALHFAQQVEQLSDGKMKVQIYPAEQLGKELEMIRSIQQGIMDITVSGESMQNWTPYAAFCGMPYLIDDLEHAKTVVDGPSGNAIASEIQKKTGLIPIGYYVRGARHLTANRAIKTPQDLNGIILRVPNVPISVATWEALGAKPTPMAFSEVFTGLQSGTIEAQENPLALINSAGFHEVQSHVNLTQHVIGWVYVLMGENQFNALSPEFQEIVLEAGKSMQAFHQQLFVAEEELLRKQLQEKGMTMVEVDLGAFKRKADAVVAESIPEEIRPMYQAVKGAAGNE